jgi:hypothetical protein
MKVHRSLRTGFVAAAIAVLACLAIWPSFGDPVKWTPDGLYYQARVLEIRGKAHDAALEQTFDGPISAKLRAQDPEKTGNPAWVRYNEPFYERRVAVPLAAAALYPVAGNRSLLYLSLAGYVAAILALFGLLLLRFRLAIAAVVAVGAAFLPPLVHHASFPLTDSWGLALEIVAFAAALLTLDRGRRWLLLWVATIVVLSFVRDSTWIPVLAAGWCALRFRTRESVSLFATGVAAALPALLVFTTPARDLLALLVNHSQVPSDPSWGFVVSHYPRAVFELVRANVGFLRRGEWYTAFFLVGGVIALLVLVRKRLSEVWPSMLTAGVVVAFGYVLAAPVFSAFRLELVFVPMAAYGLALATERVAAHAGEPGGALERVAVRIPVRTRRS